MTEAAPHDFGSTQVTLTGALADRVRRYRAGIDPADLGPGGLETEPHITVRYGLHPGVEAAHVAHALAGQVPAAATFGETATFPEGAHGVPLYVAVDSPDLHRLNAAVATLPHTDTHPGYTPHLTLAYLTPEAAARYAGESTPITGRTARFDRLTFSDRERRQTEIPLGEAAPMPQTVSAEILKTDPDRQLVFGWASVSVTKDGGLLVDRQGDVILPADLEDAAYDFVLHSRAGDEMHDQSVKATLVESVVITAEKLDKMGLSFAGVAKADRTVCMWWTGFKVTDPALWKAIRTGKYAAFSIGGSAARVPLETTA